MSVGQLVQEMPFPDALKIAQDSFTQAIAANTLGSDEAREQFLQMGVRLAQIQIPPETPATDAQAAATAINNFIVAVRDDITNSFPRYQDDVRMLSIYGLFYNGTGDPVSAEQVLTIAHNLAPKKQLVSLDLMRAYMMGGKIAEGYALARETYDLQPLYPEVQKWYILTAIFAKSFNEARAHMAENGQTVPFDGDILNAAVSTGQIALALEMLNDVKKNNPAYGPQVDEYIRQLLSAPKK
jgi:predicted Zn-dependent protease